MLTTEDGTLVSDPEAISTAIVDYYQRLLGVAGSRSRLEERYFAMGPRISIESRNVLAAPVTGEEVKEVIWSIGVQKSPGPDGYSATFFKCAWPVIGEEVIGAVLEVFQNRRDRSSAGGISE